MDVPSPKDVLGENGSEQRRAPEFRRKPHLKIRKMPMFFACLAVGSFVTAFVLGFLVAFAYSSLVWALVVSMGVTFASLVWLRILVVRHKLNQRALLRQKIWEAPERPEAQTAVDTSPQHVFDAEDMIRSSPFTIEQLREVALNVAAEAHDDVAADSPQWTPIDLPKPLYTETPKAQPYRIEALEKADYKAAVKETARKAAGNIGSETPLPQQAETSASGSLPEEKTPATEPISNLNDVLERRRAF